MENAFFERKWKKLTGMIFIAIGLSLSGYFIGYGMMGFKKLDRTVIVKGISEREVKSDLAVWELNFRNSGDDLGILNKKMEQDREIIMAFLKGASFEPEEITKGYTEIIDKLAREYGEQSDKTNRYILKENVIIRTKKVDLIIKTLGQVSSIIDKGVIVSGMPAFYYTKFFDLRPEMLAEATQSARQVASQFAKDSGSQVGNIRTASQGLFSISAKDSFGENAASNEYSSVDKKIRVVSTVTFNLD